MMEVHEVMREVRKKELGDPIPRSLQAGTGPARAGL
jgi:hypothetical protein